MVLDDAVEPEVEGVPHSLRQCEGREESSIYVLEAPLLEPVWSKVSWVQEVKDSVANDEGAIPGI